MPRKTNDVDQPPLGLERSGPVFDRATRLARSLFGEVEAQITLLTDSGQWRSRPARSDVRGDARGVREVMRLGEALWVADARRDPRFADDPVVAGPPHVRFFAGAPIRLADGSTPGALWVAGPTPRPLEPVLARRLQDLADFVADEWVRANAERSRRAQERTTAAMVEAMPLAMVLIDREARVRYASPRWIKARGLEGGEVVGRTLFELRPDIFEPWREGIAHCLKGHSHSVDRVRAPTPDGGDDVEWVRVELTPWYEDGRVGGLVMVSYDITHIVEALEHTERSKERLRLAVDLAGLYVFEIDYVRGEIVQNGAADGIYDREWSYEELARDPWAVIDPRDRDVVQASWFAGDETSGAHPEYRVLRDDGREVWVTGTAKLIEDDSGRPLRLIGIQHNITRRKAAETALLQAKEEAEAANRAKSAFLATMSHEIRTPLNGVLGMAQAMAAEPDLSETQRERLEVIRQSGESLLAILNDVLDLSKIEAGKLALETARFEVSALAKTVHATFEAIAQAKGLSFELSVDRAARGVYEGDQVRVRQILWNLVSNALKFTEKGGVKVRIGREQDALSLTVMDSGIGMTPRELSGVFRKFEQADASTTRKFGGTGLGLAICRELAGLMGGSISATSAPGMGSTFTVLLPLRKVADAAPRPKPRAKPQPAQQAERAIRVLAAEDNAMNQLVLRTLLAQAGIEPVIVSDGREAVEAWEREPWDVILMDVQMPEMDGPTATGVIRMRERSEGRTRTPIVALTANAMSHQISEYMQSGMDAFVAKPIEAQRLYEALQAVLAPAEGSADSAAA